MANFRKFLTSSGKLVLSGKDKETNELLIHQVEKDNYVLHTKEKGSPFCEIKGKANKKDIKEAAVFISKFSQDWKKNKKDILVHYFLGKDIFKTKDMKTGTFLVRKFKEIKVKKEEIQKFEKFLTHQK